MRPVALVLFASLFFVSMTTTYALAGGSPRAHDGGFFLRLSGGLGSATTEVEPGTDEIELSDLSFDANFAVGGIVSRNLALHGTFWGWTMGDPDAEFNDVEINTDGTVSLNAVGPGVTYYLMPANVYLSGAAGIAWMSFDGESFEDFDSDTGFALDATVGKEWWVGNNWGLGLAGTVGYHSVPLDGIDENLSGMSFGLRFSATLN